jgi:hypothetical protein
MTESEEMKRWRTEDEIRKAQAGFTVTPAPVTFVDNYLGWILAAVFVGVCAYFTF